MLTFLADKEQPAQAGPLGLFVILLLGVALFLLIRSMNRHLRRVPQTFAPPAPADPADGDPPPADLSA
ncbi:MAG: hypothetical protein DLM59_07905 [Pseudonocardiales bacterium]|nr:MAG: hypothetical protein DLM59_07905 [Pseudonocardiales bacterium]